jgi:Ca2+:H+ antiporter
VRQSTRRSAPLTRADTLLLAAAGALTAAAGASHFAAASTVAPFFVSAAALAVIAAVVGKGVDELGERVGPGKTGAIQGALGNLPELFFSIFALRAGLVEVVQSALIGSIIANVLLVLGLAFIAGGARHGTQRFAVESARTSALLLTLAVAILMVPTVSARLAVPVSHHEHALSNVAAVVLLVVFALSLPTAVHSGGPAQPTEPSGARWPTPVVAAVLAGASAAAAFVSNWFVDSLAPAIATLHISQAFVGFVIVAIAGNAAENFAGVRLAAQNRADYAVSLILQSPVQIALGLIPVLVLLSNVLGGVTLTLVLPVLLVVALAIGTVVVVVVVFDGESTWLEGVTLVGLYVTIAAAFWWG